MCLCHILSTGKRHKGGQRKRYKDVLKSTLKAYNIPVNEWQAFAQDRPAWRAAIRKGTKHFERNRLQSLDDKRSARKNRVPNPSTAVPCQLCGKICASTFGLQAHMRKHQHRCVIFEIEGLLLLWLCVFVSYTILWLFAFVLYTASCYALYALPQTQLAMAMSCGIFSGMKGLKFRCNFHLCFVTVIMIFI